MEHVIRRYHAIKAQNIVQTGDHVVSQLSNKSKIKTQHTYRAEPVYPRLNGDSGVK